MADTQTATKKAGKESNLPVEKKILEDYQLAVISRETSVVGRREVLTGKAMFGIFGDGKELPQIVMAKYFRNGDFRSGYYRDQTLMMAIGQLTVEQFFAELYAHADIVSEPSSVGRQMNAHFSTRSLDSEGNWKNLMEMPNSSPDISPTSGQMARLLGLAQASVIYRNNDTLHDRKQFSDNGNEVAFGTIGDASTSEGVFWETVNAAGVLQVPMVLSVWDDNYGISVPKKFQTTKSSISEALQGLQRNKKENGIEILTVRGWDYVALIQTYAEAVELARSNHIPVLVHVTELTQPQGHSTSGSHERYKSPERLEWEREYDCNLKFRQWIIDQEYAAPEELDKIQNEARKYVREAKQRAWKTFRNPINEELKELNQLLDNMADEVDTNAGLHEIKKELKAIPDPLRKDLVIAARKALWLANTDRPDAREALMKWYHRYMDMCRELYDSHVLSETDQSPLKVKEIRPVYSDNPKMVDGRVVLRDNFDALLAKYPEVLIFGEDTGKLGDVNLGLENLQSKYGNLRVTDTGIRESTILGQGIGMAMRGLRPIAEVQYLDYILYCLQVMSDDLSTVRYRTKSGQKAPVIVRTRGHRLVGIWHSGSPMGMLINAIKGMHICVPRNLITAAGFYNTLLKGDDPALMVEPLNAYRVKEASPDNPGEYTVPLGVPEIVIEGSDITVVSYGAVCTIAEKASKLLKERGISVELIDVRTLMPFDINHTIVDSLKKTNRIIFADEDFPGGTTAYMMQKVLEEQNGYSYLDSKPQTVTAKEHRPAYGPDGDYFSKPSVEDIYEAVYRVMSEADPSKFPPVFD